MSAFRTGVFTVELTERLGIGVTLNPDGSIASVDGPTIRRVTVAPTQADNAGSLALRTNGGVYVNVDGTAAGWIPIGGAAGWLLPDDVSGIWGTAAPGQVTSVYVSVANRWDLVGDNTTDLQASTAYRLRTGTSTAATANGAGTGLIEVATGATTASGAFTSGASGAVTIATGTTDRTDAAAGSGNTGVVTIASGNAISTLGVSGSTGNVSLISGNSEDANSGNIVLTTGTAVGTRGVIDINALTLDFATQDTQFLLEDNDATALSIGATGALTLLVFDTRNGVEEITLNGVGAGVNGVNGIRAIDNVAFTVGTAANDRFRFQYASVGTTGQILGTSITAGGAMQATRPLLIETGARIKNDADAGVPISGAVTVRSGTTSQTTAAATGGASGAAIFASGSTDVTFAGATGGASGTLTVQSGNTDIGGGVVATGGATGTVTVKSGDALSTSGTSGVSGNLTLSTGTSADAGTGTLTIESGAAQGAAGNTGNLTVRSGNAAGATLSGNVAVSTGTAAGVGTTGTISFTTGNPGGDGTTGPITATTGTTTGAAGTGLISLTTGGSGTGTTGNVNIITGNSPAGAGISGNIRLVTGTAGTTRGRVLVEAPILDLVTQATNLDLIDNNAAGLTVRAGAGGLAILTVVTTNAAEAFNYAARVTTTDGVAAGTARIVGGRAFASVADSAELAQAAAGYVAFDTTYSIPADTLKAGSVLRIVATVRVTTVLNAAATAQVQLQIGGANFGTSGESTAGAAGTRCRIVAEFTTRAAPGAGIATAGMASLQWSDTVAAVVLFPAAAVAVPTLATNGPLVVGVAVESSGAGDGSGRIVLEQLDIEII